MQVFNRLVCVIALLLPACGDPPEMVGQESGPAASAGIGTDSSAQPAGPMVTFSGKIALRAEVEVNEMSCVFVTVRPAELQFPWIVKKISMGEATQVEGGYDLSFVVDETDVMAPGMPRPEPPYTLAAKFSASGYVENSNMVVSEPVTVEPGQSDVQVTLSAK